MVVIGDLSKDTIAGETYFPTLVFYTDCSEPEAVNEHLLALIYSERERDKEGVERSNFKKLGGWHSRNNLQSEEAYKPLTDRVHQAGQRISNHFGYDPTTALQVTTMWSIINPPGSFNKAHIHGGSHWSGVYYVQTPEDSGDIEFTDPRTPHIMSELKFDPAKKRKRDTWNSARFTPKPGKLILFPSWLYHSVEPNLSSNDGKDSDRVIISFNLRQITI